MKTATKLQTPPTRSEPPALSAQPFVKWAGGKRSLVPEIKRVIPARFGRYWEPFLGGGAVFFSLRDRISRATLTDINSDLILTYQIIKKQPEELIGHLREHQLSHQDPDYYYQVRDSVPSVEVERAARFIYLNKTCFNGLYRVNRQNKFNVPRGSYTNPNICDQDNLLAVSRALQKIVIKNLSFQQISPQPGDLVYCDPPYDGTFTGYIPGGFGPDDQTLLHQCALEWMDLAAKVILSNSDTEYIRGLYRADQGFHLRQISAPRPINSNGNGRQPQPELLITTFQD